MNNWKPIDTAPRDTRILLWYGKSSMVQNFASAGRWVAQETNKRPRPYWECEMLLLEGSEMHRRYIPTHWIQIPKGPEDETI